MLLLHGIDDCTVDAISLTGSLRDKGEPVTVRMYSHIGHIGLLLSLSRSLQGKLPTLQDTLQFIHEMLRHPRITEMPSFTGPCLPTITEAWRNAEARLAR